MTVYSFSLASMSTRHEEFRVNGDELLRKVKDLLKSGKARRIIIKNEKDEVLLEIPLVLGAVGAILVPTLAAVGAIAALVTSCTIILVKDEQDPPASSTDEEPTL